jgi:signal peptidase I
LALQSMNNKTWSGFLQPAKTVLFALLIAVGIRSILFEPFHIPSGSMIPTLLVGDYLFVAKYSYGYSRFSFPFSPALFSGRLFAAEPKRGDVVVFRKPTDVSVDYIKRMIGLPGDRIQMKRGLLYINGDPVRRERVDNFVDQWGNSYPQYVETLPNGASHRIIQQQGDTGPLADTPEVLVQPGHYFMMGDNRDDSMDSRTTEVGQVPAENLIGPAELLFFSLDQTAPWWEVWKWPLEIRYLRLLSLVR